ncbi:beta strand repeat-containing protein [Sporomusa malonica]|uniref:Filamentous hemagglutinin family N-terminal domain-containing protein n=1 Tax=Sporomusa malonica TaxID=112901 RepID=A0A1W2DFF0_9FIRM|nr:filamentous hemagglutinin N-terminal domain-containing protein [Sporomusa malonica]SMC96269.1 filamentous hemagglutinin family N-terminal domain-containing protein [Sporomusa malonica]
MQRKWRRNWVKGKPGWATYRPEEIRVEITSTASRLAKKLLPPVAAAAIFLSAVNVGWANPTGGTVTSGAAAITTNGSTMTVNQSTNKAIINWQSFSIAGGETVNFVQPGATSVALNRVIGNSASNIYGTLSANGRVFLINPSGILFAPGAQVNVSGLVASTLNIADSDFLSGNYTFSKAANAGSVVNQGTLTAADHVVLLGPQVKNEGVIAARVTALAAGSKVGLDFNGDKLLNVTVDTGALGGSAVNTGSIRADGGLVIMSAGTKDALLNTVVNNRGVIRAQSVNNVNGVIRLEGGTVTNSGALDASGKAAGQTGGTVKVLGDTVTLASGSSIDVAGDAGGGTALIGGAYQGGSSEYAATNTAVAAGATIIADAITSGNGGQVVVWANDTTNFAGTITAKGGSASGNGGSVETSGKQKLTIADTANVNTLASKGIGGKWLLDPADFTIAASGGDITGTLLSGMLKNNGAVEVTVGGSGNVDNITINDAVTWDTVCPLILMARNNIYINAAITAPNGGLNLWADSSNSGNGITSGIITASAAVSVKTFTLNNGTWRQIASVLPAFSATDFRPARGATFIRAIAGDGSTASPYQISDVYGLQGVGGYNMVGKNHILVNDLDVSSAAAWNSGKGFNPIGSDPLSGYPAFSGTFDGLGHTITGLTINRPGDGYIGLFGYSTGTIRNVGLVGGSITGSSTVGGLVGWNAGSIMGSYNTGAVTGSSTVGGLVGYNNGSITGSYSTGAVNGTNSVGGLVGENNTNGSITSSHSTGAVNGASNVGGLAGMNLGGSITGSYSTGAVTGSGTDVGGLAGYNNGSITTSYSTGSVAGSINSSFLPRGVGGLVGTNDMSGSITNSYSAGAVTGSISGTKGGGTGGLVGYNKGSITNSYSTGSATGTVSATSGGIGGLVGWNDNGSVTGSYWNTTNNSGLPGIAYGATTGTNAQATGLTEAQMKQAANFAGWNISDIGGDSTVWRIYAGQTAPLLRSLLTQTTVNADSVSKTYDGAAYSGPLTNVNYSPGTDTGLLSGTLSYGSGKNAGAYGLTGLYSTDNQGYDVSYSPGSTLTINKAALTVSTGDVTKTYDGTTTAAGSAIVTSGTLYTNASNGGVQDTVSGGSFAFTNASAGIGNKTVTVSDVTVNDGNGGNNYTVTYAANTSSTINKAALTVSTGDVTKTYDGTTTVAGSAIVTSGTLYTNASNGGVQDTVSGGSFAFTNASAGIGNKTVTVSDVTVNDGNGGNNYTVTYAANTSSTINKAALTVTANNASRYTGQANPAFTASYSGLAAGDTPASLSGTLAFATAATTNSSPGSYAITPYGLTSPNYTVSFVNGVLTVRPASNPAYLGAVGTASQTGSSGGSTGNGFGPNGYWGLGSGFGGHMGGIFGPLYTIADSGINLSGLGQFSQDRQ